MFKLRKLQQKDISHILEWMQDKEIASCFRFDATQMDAEKVEKFIEDSKNTENSLHLACVNEEDEYLGTVSLKNIDYHEMKAEYAIAFRKKSHGSGAAAFATKEILHIAFQDYHMTHVYLEVLEENQRARRFYEKIGFLYQGILPQTVSVNGVKKRLCGYQFARENGLNAVKMLEFAQHGDERGHLVVLEGYKDIPFDIKRVFYIYGSDGQVIRGSHANRRSAFVLVNVAGKSKVRVCDGRKNEAVFCLNRPHTGVYLPTMVWKDMYDFSQDSVLLVLASEAYDPEEYIRDFAQFEEEVLRNER